MNFALVLRAGSAVPLRFEDPSVMRFSDSAVPVGCDFLDSPVGPQSVGTTLQGSFLTPVPEPSELFSLEYTVWCYCVGDAQWKRNLA